MSGAFATAYSSDQAPAFWNSPAERSMAAPTVASADGSRVAEMTSNVTLVISRSISCVEPAGEPRHVARRSRVTRTKVGTNVVSS